ncbi:MAG: hypothetical protein ACQR33_03175 [Candidatus Saccharibacteria bacterium]
MRELYPEQEVGPEDLAKLPVVELVPDTDALIQRLDSLNETPHEVWTADSPEQLMNGITAFVEATGTIPPAENARVRMTRSYYKTVRAREAHQTLQNGGFILRISTHQ